MSAITLPRKRWTRVETDALVAMGVLDNGRYELIRGEIIEKMPQKPTHSLGVNRLILALSPFFGLEKLRAQQPLVLSIEDEPEPDMVVTVEDLDAYAARHPEPSDTVLVVEVSLTTLRDDLGIKAELYAQAGISEYWVLDIENRRLHVHRQPSGQQWGVVTILADTQSITPLAAPNATIAVLRLLP